MNTKDIRDYYKRIPFELTKAQKTFLEVFTTSIGHFSLLGIQGSGKTTIMELLSYYYGSEVLFCGSSGVSSKNLPNGIGAGTGHRVLSIPRDLSTPDSMKKVSKTCQQLFASSDLIKVIVIDEAYMYDADNLYVIFKRIDRFNKKTRNRGLRNIRLLLVGDCLQKPPICKPERKEECYKRYGHWLMFKSNIWKERNIQTYVLDEVKRQDDKVFKEFLNVIRYGQESRYDKALSWINQRVVYNYNKDNLLLAPTNTIVTAANENALNSNPNPKGVYNASIWGEYDIKESPVDLEVKLAIGAPVISLINSECGSYCNGSYGHIIDMEQDGCMVKFSDSDETIFVGIHEFLEEESYVEKDVKQEDGTYRDELRKREIGGCRQVPLKLAAAYTISRAQGKTFTCPITVDMGGLFPFRNFEDFGVAEVLVGLSRATSVDNITLAKPIQKEHIKVCRESVDYWIETLTEQKRKYSE